MNPSVTKPTLGPEIHGHEVMRMMGETSRAWTRLELVAAIVDRFGAEARFHTCSAANLTAEGIVAFLESRGKFVFASDAAFRVDPSRICNHDE
jgi:probable metal-binding protein